MTKLPVVGYVEAYCQNTECIVRETDIKFKNHDAETMPKMHCPACCKPLAIHAIVSFDQRQDEHDKRARENVNCQRWVRDNIKPGQLPFVPIRAMCDDSLPE